MSDLISRKAAIDELNERQKKLIYCFGFENDVVKIMDIAKSIVIAIPPEQPERKRGRWIEYIPEHGKCPFCGNQVDLLNGKENNFCGECGAYMRGEQNG